MLFFRSIEVGKCILKSTMNKYTIYNEIVEGELSKADKLLIMISDWGLEQCYEMKLDNDTLALLIKEVKENNSFVSEYFRSRKMLRSEKIDFKTFERNYKLKGELDSFFDPAEMTHKEVCYSNHSTQRNYKENHKNSIFSFFFLCFISLF